MRATITPVCEFSSHKRLTGLVPIFYPVILLRMTAQQHKTVTRKRAKKDETEWPGYTKDAKKMGTNNKIWIPN